MWGRRRRLEDLYEELKAIAMLDRLCDNGAETSSSDEKITVRHKREAEILAAITKLSVKRIDWLH